MSANLPINWGYYKKKWKKQNPPDKDGNYQCWLCPRKVHKSIVTIDHVAPLELYPEYAKEMSNLRPAHRWCNEERASNRLTTLRRRGVLKTI